MVPLLFVTTLVTRVSAPAHGIHSPYRVLSSVLPWFEVRNSSRPLRVGADVIMAFSVEVPGGGPWSARVYSSGRRGSNLFLMDRDNMPIAHANLTAGQAGGFENRLTVYDAKAMSLVAFACLLRPFLCLPRSDPNFLLYRLMEEEKK